MELERRQGERAHLDRTISAPPHSHQGGRRDGRPAGRAIAEFTHGIEAVLDRIRIGALAVDSDVIGTMLDARDHLSAAVEAEAARSPIPAPADLNRRLGNPSSETGGAPAPAPRAHVRRGAGTSIATPPSPTVAPPTIPVPAPAQPPAPRPPRRVARKKAAGARARRSRAGRRELAVDRRPFPVDGVDGGGAFIDRAQARPRYPPPRDQPARHPRRASRARADDQDRDRPSTSVPPLDEMDPERCYLVWTVEVETDATPDRLDDVFLFLADDSTVTIERHAPDGSLIPPPTGVEQPAIPAPKVVAAPAPPPVVPDALVGSGSTALYAEVRPPLQLERRAGSGQSSVASSPCPGAANARPASALDADPGRRRPARRPRRPRGGARRPLRQPARRPGDRRGPALGRHPGRPSTGVSRPDPRYHALGN